MSGVGEGDERSVDVEDTLGVTMGPCGGEATSLHGFDVPSSCGWVLSTATPAGKPEDRLTQVAKTRTCPTVGHTHTTSEVSKETFVSGLLCPGTQSSKTERE